MIDSGQSRTSGAEQVARKTRMWREGQNRALHCLREMMEICVVCAYITTGRHVWRRTIS